MSPQPPNPGIPAPEVFLADYDPSSPVIVGEGEVETTLGQALAGEALMCKAKAAVRRDPDTRTTFLAGILDAGGSLLPEHEYLVSKPE